MFYYCFFICVELLVPVDVIPPILLFTGIIQEVATEVGWQNGEEEEGERERERERERETDRQTDRQKELFTIHIKVAPHTF